MSRPDNPDRKEEIMQNMMKQTYLQMVGEGLLPRPLPEFVGMLYYSNFLENLLPDRYRSWVRMALISHFAAFYDKTFRDEDLEYLRAR